MLPRFVVAALSYKGCRTAALRESPIPHGYVALLFVIDALCMTIFALWRRGHSIVADARVYWKAGLFGGALSVASYWIAIWTMTVAPIAMVPALRETSVLFAAVIAVFILREPPRLARVAAALMIVCGLVLIKLQ